VDDTDSTAYADASRFVVASVRLVPAASWDAPGLGSWNVRELVGHVNRGHTTIEEYLTHPQPPQGPEYFTDEAIAARARQAVDALGDGPLDTVSAASERVIALVRQSSPDDTIGSPIGTMTLADYLPSRTAELTIHGLDLTRALGADLEAPISALRASLAFVARRAADKSGAVALLALTGRGALPDDYSVF
jgi:uncharacterized protein (TIGR03086 family)